VGQISESIRIALRSLTANKTRATLTMLGIIIGVGAVIALVSVGQGFQEFMTQQFEGLGTNLIYVIPVNAIAGGSEPLTNGDAAALRDRLLAPDVAAVAPVYQQPVVVVHGQQDMNSTARGVTPEYQAVRNFKLTTGGFITQEMVTRRARVALLGHDVAEELFPKIPYPIGELIRINNAPFEVIGVLEEKGGFGPAADNDNVVLIPLTTAQTRLFQTSSVRGEHTLSSINVQVTSEERMEAATRQTIELLRQRHQLDPEDEDDFTVFNQADLLGTAKQLTGTLTVFLGAIAAISLLVGGIGIMNIMLVSVTERTREIGLRKAVGARRKDILTQFLIEAMTLSLIGGSIGIGLGSAASQAIANVAGIRTVITPAAVALAVGFSAAVGLFFGIYPAMRAARLNPIEALRYE
jgi:putative ABC transport system permease protein